MDDTTGTQQDPNDQYMTPDELSDWLKVRKDWVYDAVQRKAIPHTRVGRLLRFHRGEVRAWLKQIQESE